MLVDVLDDAQALAGIIGGRASEVSAGTRTIAIESACFNPKSVRLTSRRLGLKTEVGGRSLRDVAREVVAIAKMGLKNRGRFSGGMVDERGYLSELEDIADSGITPAERLLELYHGDWQGDVSRVYRDFAY